MFSSSEDATGPSRPQKQPRKINRSQPQLKRNAACLPCRRRRIKCDAAKPHCSSCVRSYHFLARTYPDAERDTRGVQCTYAEDAPDAVHNEQQSQGLRSRLSQPTKRKLSEEDEEDGDPEEMIRKLKGEVGTCFGFIYWLWTDVTHFTVTQPNFRKLWKSLIVQCLRLQVLGGKHH